tara:strand:+ start:81 stop:1265 length:1185 start_codon:yes stop_codon:yes gene_type:complete
MANPLSGHTNHNITGGVDGLGDGDHILSPSLTNLYEGIHGNGIILQNDGAAADANRGTPIDLPGAVIQYTAGGGAPYEGVTIKGGFCVLDGVVYKFANGPGGTLNIVFDSIAGPIANDRTGNTSTGGGGAALTAGKECLYTIYVTADNGGGSATAHVCYMQSSVITVASDSYADGATDYLSDPHGDGALNNQQSVVLAVVRAEYHSGSAGTDKANVIEVNDKRHFLNGGPYYFHPLKLESGSGPVDSATDLDALHGGGDEAGAFTASDSDLGALWLTQNANNVQSIYFSGLRAANDRFARPIDTLGDVEVISTSGPQTFKFNGKRIWIITAGAGLNLNPSGNFEEGYTVEVQAIGNTVTFDSAGTCNQAVAAGRYARFVYTGSAWVKVFMVATL